jgi:RND family efflux transporter MFP subunit
MLDRLKTGCALLLLSVAPAFAGTLSLAPTTVTEWKAVYGTVQARDTVPARARIGGTISELEVTEGDPVKTGQKIATVHDDKIAFQIAALDAQIRAQDAQLATAQSELTRGETLLGKGIVAAQQLDQLRTAVDVARNQIAATEAQKAVVLQQQAEGGVFAPTTGRVLTVPVTRDAVVLAGETIATIGGGGFYLRLAIPERHARALKEGVDIRIDTDGKETTGKLVKIYPEIQGGRVSADVEVQKLDTSFVEARVLVKLPVGERHALLVPRSAVTTRSGIDFVTVEEAGAKIERAVVLGEDVIQPGGNNVEILTGVQAGDLIVTP